MTTHRPSLSVDQLVEELRLVAMGLFTAQRGFERQGETRIASRLQTLLDGVRAVIGETDPSESLPQRRFFALRASGYTGPINENGEPVTDGAIAEILAELAQIPATSEVSQ